MDRRQIEQQWMTDVRNHSQLEARVTGIARDAGRELTPHEIGMINDSAAKANATRAQLNRVTENAEFMTALDRGTNGLATRPPDSGDRGVSIGGGRLDLRAIGQQFVSSETFRWLQEHRGHLPTGAWTSPSSELLAASDINQTAITGGASLIVPDYQTGIVPIPTRPLVVADLMAPGTTNSNAIMYSRESSIVNNAQPVLEGNLKAESILTFEAATDPVRKIATWIPVTEELVEDAPAFPAYLNARLGLFVQLAEDDQLLNGNGIAPNLMGVLHRPGLAAPVALTAPENNADAILRQISAIEIATQLMVDAIVLNPVNWNSLLTLKDSTGVYIAGGGPFGTPQQKTLWGRNVALTAATAAGVAVVGAFRTASQIFRRGGLRVEASNSHADFFTRNMIAVRAEERLALAVYRENAFGQVTGLL